MKFTNKTQVSILLLVIALVLACLQWFATGVSGETDSITHYQIARYAFKYPENFLNHWGKPLYTIFSAPIAQFGYTGSIAFNLLCGLLSGWIAYLIASNMKLRHAWAAIIFTVFTPTYLFIMYTSLTEIFFSLVLIWAIYLFISQRFVWSAVVVSFLPFARTEGMMFIVLFIPALVWMRQYKALPFLLSGFAVFGVAGWPVYHDLLWFFTKMPYGSSGSELYGSGPFWFYFRHLHQILDYPLIILCVTGLIAIGLNLKNGLKNLHDIKYVTLYFLIIPSLFGFIFAQSFLWWRGIMGVLGSNRFMACVLPLSSIIAFVGFEWLMEKVRFNRTISIVFGAFIILLVIYKPFTWRVIPMRPQNNFAVMQRLSTWLENSPYSGKRAFYSDPSFPFFMEMDPYDQQKCFKIYSYENINPATLLKSGELLIWDAQFAGFEGKLPFDSLMKNNELRLMNIFTPIESFTIIGGEKYKLAVFMKAPRDTSNAIFRQFYFNDFENGLPEGQIKNVSTEFSGSGKQSIRLSPENIYSPAAEGKLRNLPGFSNISLRASARILNPSPSEKGQIILVVSIDDAERKVYKYVIAKDTETEYKTGEWFTLARTDVVDRSIPVDGNYKVYVWYTGKNKIYVDDLKLEYMPIGYE